MNRKLLLDFDGVVLRNKYLKQYQLDRSAKFIKEKTCMPIEICKNINKENYPKYGHTVTMLNKMFQLPVTLEEYNEFVFDKKQLQPLTKFIDKNTFEYTNSFNKLFDYCNKNNTEWYIFTNAHITWVEVFADTCNLDICNKKIIYPTDLKLLKPKLDSYKAIENKFSHDSHFIFIDDHFDNLPYYRKRWSALHYQRDNNVDHIINYIGKIF